MPTRIFQIDDFRLDVAARTLTHSGVVIALPPKAFDCIVYLIDHRDRAVGRDELIAAVWGKVDVSDGVLGQTILLARRAFDDTGKEQHVIRTVIRFGYQWLAPLAELAFPVALPPEVLPASNVVDDRGLPSPSDDSRLPIRVPERATRYPTRRRVAIVTIALAAAAIALGVRAFLPIKPASVASQVAAPGNAAVVLPVTVLGDQRPPWVRLGVMDVVAGRLRAAGQPIIPSDNVVALAQAYGNATADPGQLQGLAHAADAHLVVEVSAVSREGRWRVSLHSLMGPAPPLASSAEAEDVLGAAREAADRFGIALGLRRDIPTDPGDLASNDPLVQQVEAALLEDKVELARSLLDGATTTQRQQPAIRFQLGRIEFQSGRLDAAETMFRALAEDTSDARDPLIHARALNAIGGIALQQLKPAAALPQFDSAIQILSRIRSMDALGKAYGNRAAAHGMQRDYAAEHADLAQSRIALATAGDVLGLAVIDSNVGASNLARDRFAEAAPILASSADRFAAFHAYAAELNARGNLALVQLALLEPDLALSTAARMGEIADNVSAPDRRRLSDLIRVEVLYANGRKRAATDLLQRTRARADGDQPTIARADAIAARVALVDGDPAAAERFATASLQAPSAPQGARETASTWLVLVRAQLRRGDADAAASSLARAQAWAKDDGSSVGLLFVALAEAECSAQANEPTTRERFEKALSHADRERVPTDLVKVSDAFVTWLMARQDFRRANTIAEGVAPWSLRDYDASLLQLRVFHALRDPSAWRSALERTRALAGERSIPANLVQAP